MTGGEALSLSLAREGVEVIFGLHGVQVLGFVDALHRMTEIRWVTVRHEQTTAYMAYGYARTTVKVGVATVVPGPGALNAAAAIGTAYAASTPVLLLSGQIDSKNIGRKTDDLHEINDQLDVFKTITKWNHRIMKVEAIPEAIQQAMYQLRTGRPRPVELEIPYDLLMSTAHVELLEPLPMSDNHVDANQIRTAAKLLVNATHPLIWAGGGIITGNASMELTRLAERLNSPVITTPEGKGAISEDHPFSLGVISAGPSAAIQALPKSDVILVVGSRFITARSVWKPLPDQKIIQIDIDPSELARHPEVNMGIESDCQFTLLSLLEEIPDSTKSVWQISDIVSAREVAFHQREKVAPLQMAILRTINDQLRGKGILVPDVTILGYWCYQMCLVSSPPSFLTSSYFGTLGYAFPTALGAKLGNPDKTVVALCGDGGFLYAASDLATAVKERLNLIVLVFVDNAYGTCIRLQNNQFEGRTFGSELLNPDFACLAESFGAKGISLSSHEELEEGLQAAMAESRPTVIEIPVPSMVLPWEVPFST